MPNGRKSKRGFAAMSKQKVAEIGQKGGQASPTKFKSGDERTMQAGQKGGEARAHDRDVRSGELGRKGADARWHTSQ